MEFTNDLKKKLENAQDKEEAQAIIDETKKGAEAAGIILSDADLDQAAGGIIYDKYLFI
jgi:hypothetical protein